jgi:hypothetical protein
MLVVSNDVIDKILAPDPSKKKPVKKPASVLP